MNKSLLLFLLILIFVVNISCTETAKDKSPTGGKVQEQSKEVEDKSVVDKAKDNKTTAENPTEQIQKKESIDWFKKGVEAFKSKNYDTAIECYKKAIAINPNDAGTHYSLGIVYAEKGMFDEAIPELKKTLTITPHSSRVHGALGYIYVRKGMFDEAIPTLNKAIDIDPENARAHLNLGFAYNFKRMPDMAISEYKKTIEIVPDSAEAHYNLGIAYIHAGSQSVSADNLYKAGLLYLMQGNRQGALNAYEYLKRIKSKGLDQSLFEKLHPDSQKENTKTEGGNK